jgi:diguanylate cyclase (GGDEF)-like protein/PAS domain S-box-containing protein
MNMDSKGPRLLDASILPFPRVSWKGEQLLHTILDNMSQGVLMFDSEARLVICNQRYIEMYGLSREVAAPECTLRELLNHRIQVGTFSGDPEDYIVRLRESIADGRVFNDLVKSGDGRVFSVVSRPIADGGWIATHEDITERQRSEEQIVHMARHDALTDLPNRMLLRDRLEQELKRVKRGECLAVLCLDLDQFKSVNDTLGHPIGDELLKLVADRLRGCTREPDTVARLGGDEFAIIMTQLRETTDAAALSQRIRASIVRPYQINGHQIVSDVSIGISVAPFDGTEADPLLKNADLALYGAKADGRGTYRFFEPEMDTRMRARRDLEMDLRNALLNKEFEMYTPFTSQPENPWG